MIDPDSFTPTTIGLNNKSKPKHKFFDRFMGKEFFIRQKARLDMGRNNLAIFQWVMLLFITIKTAFESVKDIEALMIVFGVIGFLWVFGFFWDKFSLPEEEKEFQNQRDRFVREWRIKQNIKECE